MIRRNNQNIENNDRKKFLRSFWIWIPIWALWRHQNQIPAQFPTFCRYEKVSRFIKSVAFCQLTTQNLYLFFINVYGVDILLISRDQNYERGDLVEKT